MQSSSSPSPSSPVPVVVVSKNDLGRFVVREFASLDALLASGDYVVSGKSLDTPLLRSELRGQPKLSGFAGPMWDGDRLRFESWAACDQLSR